MTEKWGEIRKKLLTGSSSYSSSSYRGSTVESDANFVTLLSAAISTREEELPSEKLD